MTPPDAFARLEAAVTSLRARVLERAAGADARVETFGAGPGSLIVAASFEHESAGDDLALEVGVNARALPGGGLAASADLSRRSGEPVRELEEATAATPAEVAALVARVEAWLQAVTEPVVEGLAS